MSDTSKNMNYTVGRGRLYFDLFQPGTNIGTGERYLGNTPAFGPTVDSETLDHYSSEAGIRQKDASVILQVDNNGAFQCDDITLENISLFFMGEVAKSTMTSGTNLRDNSAGVVTKGRHYQIGKSDLYPSGARNVSNVVIGYADPGVTLGTGPIASDSNVTVIPILNNAEVDLALGRIYIEPDSPGFVEGKVLVVQYDEAAQNRQLVLGKNKMAYGSLRFIADNPVGKNFDYFYPKVALTPDGEYAMKGDEWQVMGFTFQGLQLGGRPIVTIDARDQQVADAVDPLLLRVVTVVPSSTSVASGGAGVTMTITVRDGNNDVVVGENVALSVNGAIASLNTASGVTGAGGTFTATLTAATPTAVTVTATVSEAGANYTATSTGITFT